MKHNLDRTNGTTRIEKNQESQKPKDLPISGDGQAVLPPSRTIRNVRKQEAEGSMTSHSETRAVEIGCDELIALLEWAFRDRPRTLRNIRREYRDFCLRLYRRLGDAHGN